MKRYRHPVSTAALFTTTEILKQPKGPLMDDWMKWCIDTMELLYYSAIKKKNEILSFATSMHLQGIILRKIRQTEKEKYNILSLIR